MPNNGTGGSSYRNTCTKNKKSSQSRQEQVQYPYVYCNQVHHRFINCAKVISVNERKKLIAGVELRAIECRSCLCRKLGGNHYTSICNKDKRKGKNAGSSVLCTEVSKALVYPVAVVIVNWIKRRALLNIGSSSVYVLLALINQIKIALKRMK